MDPDSDPGGLKTCGSATLRTDADPSIIKVKKVRKTLISPVL
jgi:hypothetical protein